MSAIVSTFKTDQPFLRELLDAVHRGSLQLPDFQRGWVWEDSRIRALIASVSLSYPVGAVMFMETGGEGTRFAPRLVEGVVLSPPPKPERLILDGQQRLTSLYMALRSGRAVKTETDKGASIERLYYLDMKKCLDPAVDRNDAVVGVPSDKVLRSDFGRVVDLDLRAAAGEYAAELFPLAIIFDDGATTEWTIGYQEHYQYAPDRIRFLNRFQQEIRQRFLQYRLPVIELLRDTPKEAVCEVFENVNKGGVPLTVFELLTATYAADDFRLRPDWEVRSERLSKHDVLYGLGDTEFLQACTLLATYRRSQRGEGAVGVKRRDMLRLSLAEYRECALAIEKGFVACARLLLRERIFLAHNVPYASQLVPMAAIFAILDEGEEDGARQKLARWYWCGVFGELYGSAAEARFALDVQQVPAWIRGGPEPRTIQDANFAPTRLITLQTRQSAAYKGLMARLMRVGALDLRTGDPIALTTHMEDDVDIHHVFPAAWCEKQGLPKRVWNCIANKTPLTARTNRSIGGHAPSTYLSSLEKKVGRGRLDEIIETHHASAPLLRADAFAAFLRDRARRLLDEIELATAKSVTGRDTPEVLQAFGGPLL